MSVCELSNYALSLWSRAPFIMGNDDMNEIQSPYQLLGEDGIRNLVDTFYDLMDNLPEATRIRAMHGKNLSPMKEKLAEYLIGWMGGPPLYARKYGSVCMTMPHAKFDIGSQERDEWLFCMDKALEKTGASDELIELLKEPMFQIADAVKNRKNSDK